MVSADGSGASMCIREREGVLDWTVTFVAESSEADVEPNDVVTSASVPVLEIADVCADPTSDRQFTVLDARGQVVFSSRTTSK